MVLSSLTVTVTRASSSTLAVRFGYDEALVTVVKSIPGRLWNKTHRVWTIPANHENVELLRNRMPRYARVRVDDVVLADLERERQALERAAAIRAAGDAPGIQFDFRTAPYAHQRAGLAFLQHLEGGALLWEMGLGKSKTAIDYAEWLYQGYIDQVLNPAVRAAAPGIPSLPGLKVLIICPNTVKRNWAAEIEKHAGHTDYVVTEGSLKNRVRQYGSARYTIVNCEQLSLATSADALKERTWDLIVVDESTRFKTPSAARTKVLHKLKARRRVILTGTPITGKPEDAWSQLEFVHPGTFGTFYAFRDRFLQIGFFKQVEGLKPGTEKELEAKVAARSYRILKRDVLDLPEKVYAERTVTLEGDQAEAYAQMKRDLRVAIANTPTFSASNVLTMLLRLTQITAGLVGTSADGYRWLENGAKAKELDDLLNDELRGEQVVIFGQYQKELEALAARYVEMSAIERTAFDGALCIRGSCPTCRKTVNLVDHACPGKPGRDRSPGGLAPIIYGPTPEKVRHQLVEEFQAGKRRLLFCQNRTGGIGINLTAAQTAIYVTRSWSLEEWLQSQDRLHRIGQRGTVSIISLSAAKTVDEQIAKALAEKQNIADHLTGDAARRLAAEVLGD